MNCTNIEKDIKQALEEEKIGEPLRTPNGLLEDRYFLNLLQFIGDFSRHKTAGERKTLTVERRNHYDAADWTKYE